MSKNRLLLISDVARGFETLIFSVHIKQTDVFHDCIHRITDGYITLSGHRSLSSWLSRLCCPVVGSPPRCRRHPAPLTPLQARRWATAGPAEPRPTAAAASHGDSPAYPTVQVQRAAEGRKLAFVPAVEPKLQNRSEALEKKAQKMLRKVGKLSDIWEFDSIPESFKSQNTKVEMCAAQSEEVQRGWFYLVSWADLPTKDRLDSQPQVLLDTQENCEGELGENQLQKKLNSNLICYKWIRIVKCGSPHRAACWLLHSEVRRADAFQRMTKATLTASLPHTTAFFLIPAALNFLLNFFLPFFRCSRDTKACVQKQKNAQARTINSCDNTIWCRKSRSEERRGRGVFNFETYVYHEEELDDNVFTE